MSDDDDENILILSDDQFMDGNPIIKGTQITVESLLRDLAKGMSIEQILKKYPQLTPEGIEAALKFAAESVRFDHVTPHNAGSQENRQV